MQFAELDARFFQGVIPATVATCSASGEPNVTYASQVSRLDAQRLALSCQFFNKTRRNLDENPQATLLLYDPVLFDCYRLSLRYSHSESSGPVFQQMAARIGAIASHTGMEGVFRLLSADVFEVQSCERLDSFTSPSDPSQLAPAAPKDPRADVRVLQLVSRALAAARSLPEALGEILEHLATTFSFSHSLVYVTTEREDALQLAAARGYGETQVGQTVRLGEGLIGTVARERQPLRLSALETDLRYGRAVRRTIHRSLGAGVLQGEVPLPGLFDATSQLALPLLSGEKLMGVIAVESPRPLAFDEWDEAVLEIVASQIAGRLESEAARRSSEPGANIAESLAPHAAAPLGDPSPQTRHALRFRFFHADDCVFIGDEYLVRNLPGRILWRLLRAFVDSGRGEFSNRELRLDPWLRLPPIRDNLESRLTLLRKRLEERCPELTLRPTARGCFRIEASVPVILEEVDAP